MKNNKTSTKALIIRKEAIQMIEKTSKRRQSFYTFPSSTQELAESLHRSLTREVFEETGAVVKVQDLRTKNTFETEKQSFYPQDGIHFSLFSG